MAEIEFKFEVEEEVVATVEDFTVKDPLGICKCPSLVDACVFREVCATPKESASEGVPPPPPPLAPTCSEPFDSRTSTGVERLESVEEDDSEERPTPLLPPPPPLIVDVE